jgi:hypothetical protein
MLLWSTLWWKCFSHALRLWVAVGLRRYVGVAGQTGRFIVYSQNSVTFVGVLNACASIVALEKDRNLFIRSFEEVVSLRSL